jgi:hypothetical protein
MPFAILLQSQRTTLHWSPKRTGGADRHTNGQMISIKSTAENTDDITSACKIKATKHTNKQNDNNIIFFTSK